MTRTIKMTMLVLCMFSIQMTNAQFNTLTRTSIDKEAVTPLDVDKRKFQNQKDDQREKKSRGSCCRGLSKKEERMPPGGKRKWLRFPPGGVFVSKNKDDDIQKYIAIFL